MDWHYFLVLLSKNRDHVNGFKILKLCRRVNKKGKNNYGKDCFVLVPYPPL